MGEKVMRNVENLRKVADEIESNGENRPVFDMDSWVTITNINEVKSGHMCGTAACIAGYTMFTFEPTRYLSDAKMDIISYSYEASAAEYLGLDYDDRCNLFLSSFDATKDEAAWYLRYLADNPKEPVLDRWIFFVRENVSFV